MKIIHLAMGMPEFDWACHDLGHQHIRIDWGQHPYAKRQQVLTETAERFHPDVVFMQLQTPDIVDPATIKRLRDGGAMVVNWTGDVRDPIPQHYLDMAPHVTITAFTNHPDAEALRAMGHDARFLQIGYDPEIYNADRRYPTKHRVVFIGNDYGNRFPLSEARRLKVMALHRAFPSDFASFGKGFGKILRNGADADIYRGALVAINLDHFHRPGFFSDRYIRSRACGAYTIDGTALSVDGLIDAVRAALNHPTETAELGLAQAKSVLENDRWHNRIETLEQWRATLS